MTSPDDSDEVVYFEAARTYASAWGLAALLTAGLLFDAVLGGAAVHLVGWLAAIVIVVGADVLVIRAARTARSITVTRTELWVGDEVVDRGSIEGIAPEGQGRVLGRRPGEGLPRGAVGLPLLLADEATVIVPTRHPRELRSTLEVGETMPEIRVAEDNDLAELVEVERRSNTLFTVAGIGPLPDPAASHERLDEARLLLVAGRPPVGFARVDEVDGRAHLEQISVLPGHMRRGIGTALLEAAAGWAVEHGYRAMTVCTFGDVEWNAPYYAKRGFVPLAQLTPGLAELRDWERDIGLDAIGRRVVMRRELQT
ncbi:MAG TPA: GNAT family N-acetyltransferase [Jatrophihabitantaceae bacterium]